MNYNLSLTDTKSWHIPGFQSAKYIWRIFLIKIQVKIGTPSTHNVLILNYEQKLTKIGFFKVTTTTFLRN